MAESHCNYYSFGVLLMAGKKTGPEVMSLTLYLEKELVSEIRSLAQSQGLNTVFTTFLEIAANSLAAQTDPENAEKRE